MVNSIKKGNAAEREFSKLFSQIINMPLQRTPLFMRKMEQFFGDVIPTLESGIDPRTFPYLINVRCRREAWNKKGFTPVVARWFYDMVRKTVDIQKKLKQDFRKKPVLAIKGIGKNRGKWFVVVEDYSKPFDDDRYLPPNEAKVRFYLWMGVFKTPVPDDLKEILKIC